MRPILVSLLLLCTSGAAQAGQTDWQDVAPGAQMRLISSDSVLNGQTTIAVELHMQPGLKTYWRVPGETGIPAQISLTTASQELTSTVHWPLPQWDVNDGFVDFVYRGDLVLPLSVALPQNGQKLSAEVIMGVCSDICVPVKAKFDLSVNPGRPDIVQGLRIRQAVADAPVAWPDGSPPPLSGIVFDPTTRVLSFSYDPTLVEPTQIFPTLDGAPYIFEPVAGDNAAMKRIQFHLLTRPGDQAWRNLPIRLSFMSRDGAFEIVEPAAKR